MIGQRVVDGLRALTLATPEGGGIEAAFVPDAGWSAARCAIVGRNCWVNEAG